MFFFPHRTSFGISLLLYLPSNATQHPLCRFDEEPGLRLRCPASAETAQVPDLPHRKGTFSMSTVVPMSIEVNKTTNRRFYEEVINQKHLAVLDEIASATYVNHSLPPGLPPGREGLKAFVSAFHAAFPDGRLSIDQMIAEGDTVATRLTFRGTHTGDFLGIPPTGKQVAVPALDMARYADGKLVEHWGGPDQMSLMQQLGVIPSMG